MSELKPCPFCGGKAHIQGHTCIDRATYFTVDCYSCGVHMIKHQKSEQDAKAAWNRRAQPAACEIAEYAEDCKDCGFCAQLANEPLTLERLEGK